MPETVLGPVLADIQTVANGKNFSLATAFYSGSRLESLATKAQAIDIMVRFDLNSLDDWICRATAPDALLKFWEEHREIDISVFYSPSAHVKLYMGDCGFLVGSANFTMRGLAGTSNELLWKESDSNAIEIMSKTLARYKSSLRRLEFDQLEQFVNANRHKVVKKQQSAIRSEEDFVPPEPPRPLRIGTYQDFLDWISKSRYQSAKEIIARAHGRGQLSGHIRTNFYGIRQMLIARPQECRMLLSVNPDSYRLCEDYNLERKMKDFVLTEAVNESDLYVDTWRTYLPERCGGKPKTGGGTSGNLNRMFPLVAKYLQHRGL